MPSPTLSHPPNTTGDPGYKGQVFAIETTELRDSDWRHLQPSNINVENRVSCSTSMTRTEISTSAQLQTETSHSLETSSSSSFGAGVSVGGYGGGYNQANANTKSESSRQMSRSLDKGESIYLVSRAECSAYQATISPYYLPPFDDTFKKAVDLLPKEYADSSSVLYRDFIRVYGTHVIISALFGSRYGKIYTMDAKTIESEKERSKSTGGGSSTSRGGYVEGAGVRLSFNMNNGKDRFKNEESREENKLSQASTEESSFSVGAPWNPDAKEWAKQSAKEPFPIRVKMIPISQVVASIDSEKAKHLESALMDYAPSGGSHSNGNLGRCYLSTSKNLVYKSYNRRKSLVAQCKPGYEALGGTFYHLWNVNGDVQVDTLAATSHQLMNDAKSYYNIRNQMLQLDFLLQDGAGMLSQFIGANTMDNLKVIFGDRVDPVEVQHFLQGTLRSLGVDKEKALEGVADGLKVLGKSALGAVSAKFAEKNPYVGAMFNVGKSILKNLPKIEVLSVKDHKEELEHHADVLAEVIRTLDERHGHKGADSFAENEETRPQFINFLIDLATKIHDTFTKLTQTVPKQLTPMLQQWGKFSANIDDVWKNSKEQLKNFHNKIQSTELYQNIVENLQEDSSSERHSTTLLAQRNTLNWMFPFGSRSFVCGSGLMGMTPTSRSSMGVCAVYCCESQNWKYEVVKERKKSIQMEKRYSESVASCPRGQVVISGGIVLTDYQEGRFVQVLTSRPEGNDGWKCAIEWSEEDVFPYAPRFECVAKCAKSSMTPIQCENKEVNLVNGHGSAFCGSDQMALSGGWEVQSKGITYFKQTSFPDIHPYDGSRSFRCELGTSHDSINGKCVARCCKTAASGLELAVTKQVEEKCASIVSFFRTFTPAGFLGGSIRGVRAALNVARFDHSRQAQSVFYKTPTDVGSRLFIGERLDRHQVMTSQNGKYLLRYSPNRGAVEVWRKTGCTGAQFMDRIHFKAPVSTGHCNYFQMRYAHLIVTSVGLDLGFYGHICGNMEVIDAGIKYIQLQDNGNLVFYNENNDVVKELEFSRCLPFRDRIQLRGNVLKNGEFLTLDSGIESPNKFFTFVLTPSGEPALIYQHPGFHCREPHLVWTTATLNGRPVKHFSELAEVTRYEKEGWMMRMQADNNLVIYNDANGVAFASGTENTGIGKAELRVSDTGEVAIYDAVGQELWNPFTKKAKTCEPLRDRLKIRSHRMGVGAVIQPGVGGLLSRNGEYVLYIREEDGKSNLEVWANGGDDCAPLRMCTVKSNISELKVTANAILGNGKSIFSFENSDLPINQIALEGSGHLMVYAGKDNRRELEKPMALECEAMKYNNREDV